MARIGRPGSPGAEVLAQHVAVLMRGHVLDLAWLGLLCFARARRALRQVR